AMPNYGYILNFVVSAECHCAIFRFPPWRLWNDLLPWLLLVRFSFVQPVDRFFERLVGWSRNTGLQRQFWLTYVFHFLWIHAIVKLLGFQLRSSPLYAMLAVAAIWP